eukprot:498722_1
MMSRRSISFTITKSLLRSKDFSQKWILKQRLLAFSIITTLNLLAVIWRILHYYWASKDENADLLNEIFIPCFTQVAGLLLIYAFLQKLLGRVGNKKTDRKFSEDMV